MTVLISEASWREELEYCIWRLECIRIARARSASPVEGERSSACDEVGRCFRCLDSGKEATELYAVVMKVRDMSE
jgi:hypothetical protein